VSHIRLNGSTAQKIIFNKFFVNRFEVIALAMQMHKVNTVQVVAVLSS